MRLLYAYVGIEPAHLKCSLIDTKNAIVRQSAHNADGWGIAYNKGEGQLQVSKEPIQAACSKGFTQLVQSIRATTNNFLYTARERWERHCREHTSL